MSWSNPPQNVGVSAKTELRSDRMMINPIDYDRVVAHISKIIETLISLGYDHHGLHAYQKSMIDQIIGDREVPAGYMQVESDFSPGLHEQPLITFFVALEDVKRIDEDISSMVGLIMESIRQGESR